MTKKPTFCAECERKTHKGSYLCSDCVNSETVRRKHNIYTAGDFSRLGALSLQERQLAFLWACGQNILEYFDDKHAQPERDEVDFDDIQDEVLRPTGMKFDTATKYRYRTRR